MKVKNIKKLIDALESGKFKKGKGVLNYRSKKATACFKDGRDKQDFAVDKCNKNNRFCCLGVAEYIMPAKSRKDTGEKTGMGPEYVSPRYKAIGKWLGFDYDELVTLMNINDETKTFKQVVEHLKEQVGL